MAGDRREGRATIVVVEDEEKEKKAPIRSGPLRHLNPKLSRVATSRRPCLRPSFFVFARIDDDQGGV